MQERDSHSLFDRKWPSMRTDKTHGGETRLVGAGLGATARQHRQDERERRAKAL